MSNTTPQLKLCLISKDPDIRKEVISLCEKSSDLQLIQTMDSDKVILGLMNEKPDVYIVDVEPFPKAGFEIFKKIYRYSGKGVRSRILVFTALDEVVGALTAIRLGANGYLMKDRPHKLRTAINMVAAGEQYASEVINKSMMHTLMFNHNLTKPSDLLSKEQLAVFKLIGRGFSAGYVQKKLNLPARKVESHIQAIKKKLRLENGEDIHYQYIHTLGL